MNTVTLSSKVPSPETEVSSLKTNDLLFLPPKSYRILRLTLSSSVLISREFSFLWD